MNFIDMGTVDKEPKSYEKISKIPFKYIFYKLYQFLSFSYWSFIYEEYRKKFDIHPDFRFNGEGIRINGNGKLVVKGKGQFCSNTFIELDVGSEIEIGDNVVMSKNIVIYTKPYDYSLFIKEQRVVSKPAKLKIGNNVFIMPGVFILGGITIGSNVIIPPNSILIDNIPDNYNFFNKKKIKIKIKKEKAE